MSEPSEGRSGALPGGLVAGVGFVLTALVLRAPAMLYSVTNFDESLYLLIGAELAEGTLPFTNLCDRKPFGLFAIFALFALMPFDAILASRLAASIVVGLTAWLLLKVAGLLLDDRDRLIGWSAGLGYIGFSLADGGMATNSEIFLNALALLALLLALHASLGRERPRLGLMLAAGLVLGVGIQVKQTIIFDMLAFAVGYFLLTTPRWADLPQRARMALPGLAALAGMALVPTLLVILLYVVSGHWSDWALANIGAQRGFVDDPAQKIELNAGFWAMAEQGPLWVGGILAALLARWLVRSGAEARAVAFLLVWVGFVMLLQVFLRIAADHYFLQFLPALCLLGGLLLARGLLVHVQGRAARFVALAIVAGLTLFGTSKNQLVNTFYVLRDRVLYDEAWAADTPRRIAADLKPLLRPGDRLYEVGFLPIVYHLTGAGIPTRFAFTGLPHHRYAGRDGCPWLPQGEEMQRILDTRPRFIVVEQGVFYHQLDPVVKAMLDERLARDYRLVEEYDMHWIHRLYPFERFVLNAAAGARVYELAASAPPDVEGGDDVVPDHPDGDPGQG